jgi:hypothetical protein
LERAWRASGLLADEVAFLREVVRAGPAPAKVNTRWSNHSASVELNPGWIGWGEGSGHWSEPGGGGYISFEGLFTDGHDRARVEGLIGAGGLREVEEAVRAVQAGKVFAPERLERLEVRLALDWLPWDAELETLVRASRLYPLSGEESCRGDDGVPSRSPYARRSVVRSDTLSLSVGSGFDDPCPVCGEPHDQTLLLGPEPDQRREVALGSRPRSVVPVEDQFVVLVDEGLRVVDPEGGVLDPGPPPLLGAARARELRLHEQRVLVPYSWDGPGGSGVLEYSLGVGFVGRWEQEDPRPS